MANTSTTALTMRWPTDIRRAMGDAAELHRRSLTAETLAACDAWLANLPLVRSTSTATTTNNDQSTKE